MAILPPELSAKRGEKRFFTAVKVDLDARFMLESGAESRCRVSEMSTAAIKLISPARPRHGEKVIVYTTELGRFEGLVDESDHEGFSLALKLTELKHKKLAEQLVWFANRETLDMPESRRHQRIVPMMQRVMVNYSNGKEKMGKINDISLTSASIEADGVFLSGGKVTIGQKAAVITRIFDGGFVANFVEPFVEGELDETVRL